MHTCIYISLLAIGNFRHFLLAVWVRVEPNHCASSLANLWNSYASYVFRTI